MLQKVYRKHIKIIDYNLYRMPETCAASQSFSRKARLEDFFNEDDDCFAQNTKNNYNTHSQNDNVVIAKNQQHFGHRKRIKP